MEFEEKHEVECQVLAKQYAIEGKFVAWICATNTQRINFSRAMPSFVGKQNIVSASIDSINTINEGTIDFLSLIHKDYIRGHKYHLIILDPGHFGSEMIDNIVNIILRPATLDLDGKIIFVREKYNAY